MWQHHCKKQQQQRRWRRRGCHQWDSGLYRGAAGAHLNFFACSDDARWRERAAIYSTLYCTGTVR
eukprot:COSAG02_NODE_1075_length_14754_cov_18.686796_6_plen_65_part_00